ncbi:hypothetical protein EIN_306690 [Entamoeba invadens IP1]|uniref:Uncharacterized protein n=1 Tax=Entamoeba invadens IP1 TaxID=370355 RepID=A0A0A1U245_ENTIV|nr:hypothetical protein EIN_306690 [Entamoeba invadens IP1]ELP86723.1 hypothetical protein EIN_306690 [Entamoeba invadens IP1]|eukprot:XP_004186069.1 hypothetical protein EIN_306690 [Entamoeba invadens IP1]
MLSLIFFTLIFFVSSETTEDSTVPPPFTPNDKDHIPRDRSNHPVFFSGDKPDTFLNFCNNPNGFNVSDISNSCFYKPYAESLAIPSAFIAIVLVILTLVVYIFACTRCCFGPCCLAKHGCLCPKDEKSYGTKQWCIFLILMIVSSLLLVPFFIVGIIGNSSMTVAFRTVGDSLFTTYDDIKTIFDQTYTALSSVDLGPIKEIVPDLDTSMLNETTQMLSDLNTQIQGVDGTVNTGKTYVNAFYKAREALVDLILILPFIAVIVALIGAFCKLHFLVIPIFPCSIFFAVVAAVIVMVEYPVVTVVSDVCVYLIDEMNPEAPPGDSDFDQIFQVVRNCDNSTLSNMSDEFVSVENQIVDSAVEFYKQVCSDDTVSSTDFIRYDEKYTCTGTLMNNTKCVQDLNKTLSDTTSPLVCPSVPEGITFEGIPALMDAIYIKNFRYYFVPTPPTSQAELPIYATKPVRCELPDFMNTTEGKSGWVITNIACVYQSNITVSDCDTQCPSEYKEYGANMKALKDVVNSLISVISTIQDQVLSLIKCSHINKMVTNLKDATCYDLITMEGPLISGLLGYSAALLIMFVVSFLAIKRFKKGNYDFVDENTKYYDEGGKDAAIEMS